MGGGLGEPRTATTGRSSYSAGIPGNSDATCASGPMPSISTSNSGTRPWSSGLVAASSQDAYLAAAASGSSPSGPSGPGIGRTRAGSTSA